MKHFIKAQAKFLITVLTLVVLLGVGATVAYLQSTTGTLTNTFEMVELDTRIEETVNTDGTKNVVIANTGKSNAYVRARIMVSGIAPKNVEITTDSTRTKAEAGKILLVMPNAGAEAEKKWKRLNETAPATYSDDWYYFCEKLPGTDEAPDDPANPNQAKRRKTSALLEKVYFGDGVNPNEITITITHESVLAVPGDKNDLDGIKTVFDAPK